MSQEYPRYLRCSHYNKASHNNYNPEILYDHLIVLQSTNLWFNQVLKVLTALRTSRWQEGARFRCLFLSLSSWKAMRITSLLVAI